MNEVLAKVKQKGAEILVLSGMLHRKEAEDEVRRFIKDEVGQEYEVFY